MPPLSKRLKFFADRVRLSPAQRDEADALIGDLVRAECELDRARYRLQQIAEASASISMPRVVGTAVVQIGRRV